MLIDINEAEADAILAVLSATDVSAGYEELSWCRTTRQQLHDRLLDVQKVWSNQGHIQRLKQENDDIQTNLSRRTESADHG